MGQSGGVSPCRFLGFEVPDAVRLCVPDAGLFHGGFPADALLACRFGLVLTSAFGGLAAQRDLLCDLGELLFEGAAGSVGPFARSVWLAAAEDDAEAFGWGVVEAGDSDPGVLLGVGEFLVGGDVLGPVLLLEDDKPHGLALCGDGEVGMCPAAAMRWGCEAGLPGGAGVSFGLGGGDQCLVPSGRPCPATYWPRVWTFST